MLKRFSSNSQAVVQTIEEEHRAKDWKELDQDRDKLPVERAFGSDMFNFKTVLKEQLQSKQGMLSVISSLYDPLGFLAPVTLQAKVMLLCGKCCGWDDNIPADIGHRWARWLDDLKGMTVFRVERCFKLWTTHPGATAYLT